MKSNSVSGSLLSFPCELVCIRGKVARVWNFLNGHEVTHNLGIINWPLSKLGPWHFFSFWWILLKQHGDTYFWLQVYYACVLSVFFSWDCFLKHFVNWRTTWTFAGGKIKWSAPFSSLSSQGRFYLQGLWLNMISVEKPGKINAIRPSRSISLKILYVPIAVGSRYDSVLVSAVQR